MRPKSVAIFLVIILAAALFGCGGGGNSTSNSQSSSLMGPPGPVTFGFQCNYDNPNECPGAAWPSSYSQPGLIRLHDTSTTWHKIAAANGAYNWTILDNWLDSIAAHQPRAVIYTFNRTPCWDVNPVCASNGSPQPPADLTSGGSATFNAFVTALVNHCSAAGHCVKDYIKYWELWNEANAAAFWSGTVAQLYQMAKPAVSIIRSNVPGATVLTPAVSMGDTAWMGSWLQQENGNGRISDVYSLHAYLNPGSNWNPSNTPESRMSSVVLPMLATRNSAGWGNVPWMNTETGWLGAGPWTPSCPTSDTTCQQYLARWEVLQFASGAQQINFYNWVEFIQAVDSTYGMIMNWLAGGHFTAACSSNGATYSCPFVEANGTNALFVWDAGGTSTYTPDAQFVHYKDLNGNKVSITQRQPTQVSGSLIMFENR